MSKLCSLILMLCAFASLPVMAAETEEKELGFWFEAQTASRGPSKLVGWFEHDLTGSIGFFASVIQESDRYHEFYAGPTWKPAKWLMVGFGIGRESVPDESSSSRRAAFFDATWDKMNVFGIIESSGGGRWHKVTATYALNERLGAGVMHETDIGLGPRIEYNIKKNIQLWGALLREHGVTTSLLAVNFSF